MIWLGFEVSEEAFVLFDLTDEKCSIRRATTSGVAGLYLCGQKKGGGRDLRRGRKFGSLDRGSAFEVDWWKMKGGEKCFVKWF